MIFLFIQSVVSEIFKHFFFSVFFQLKVFWFVVLENIFQPFIFLEQKRLNYIALRRIPFETEMIKIDSPIVSVLCLFFAPSKRRRAATTFEATKRWKSRKGGGAKETNSSFFELVLISQLKTMLIFPSKYELFIAEQRCSSDLTKVIYESPTLSHFFNCNKKYRSKVNFLLCNKIKWFLSFLYKLMRWNLRCFLNPIFS